MSDTIGVEPDVIEREGIPRRTTRAVAVLLALLVLVGVALWAEGARRARGERAALDACARVATDAVEHAEVRIALMVNYVVPALGTGSAEVDDGLRRLIAAQAPDARGPVDDALGDCRTVEVWPLNGEHRAARAAYVTLLEAEVHRLRGLEQDGRGYYSGYDHVRALQQEATRLWP